MVAHSITLDQLEPLLTEVSNAAPEDMQAIRQRLADEDILFKLRVLRSRIGARQRVPLPRSSD